MPIILFGYLVPGPIGFFRVGKDDADALVELVCIGPDVHGPFRRTGRGVSGSLEPWVLVAGVVDDELDHHLHVASVGGVKKLLEVVKGAVGGVNVDVVGDVVAVVAQG